MFPQEKHIKAGGTTYGAPRKTTEHDDEDNDEAAAATAPQLLRKAQNT